MLDDKAQKIVAEYAAEQAKEAKTVYLHPNDYAYIRTLGKNYYDEATEREQETTGLMGHLGKYDLKISEDAPLRGGDAINSFIREAHREEAVRYQVLGDKDRPATIADIEDAMDQLAQVANDPDMTIVTHGPIYYDNEGD